MKYDDVDGCNIEYARWSDSYTILQFVAGSQPMNAVAFVFDGLYYGVSDFEYAAYSTVKFITEAENTFEKLWSSQDILINYTPYLAVFRLLLR